MSETAGRRFRDLRKLAVWSRRLLCAQAALAGAALAVALLHGPGFDDDGANQAYAVIVMLQAVAFLAAAFAVLRWTYFANADAHALGAQALSSGPGLAVGWYCIRPRDWETVRAPAVFGWWWLCWLLGNFASTASFRLDMEEGFEGASRAAEVLTNVGDAFNVAASLLLATIIGGATAQLQARHEEQVFS